MSLPAPARRFPWWIYWLLLALIVVFAFWPIASVVIAGSIADANGCMLDEGSVHPCIINGADWGDSLYTLGVLGWFMLATMPMGGLAFLVWLVVLIVHRVAFGRPASSGP
jgi:hypothetical protein